MNITALEAEIVEARTEAIACAIVGDNVGAAIAHSDFLRLQRQRDDAMRPDTAGDARPRDFGKKICPPG